MAEQTIKPVIPVNRPADSLHKKKTDKTLEKPRQQPRKPAPKDRKGIIDTYA